MGYYNLRKMEIENQEQGGSSEPVQLTDRQKKEIRLQQRIELLKDSPFGGKRNMPSFVTFNEKLGRFVLDVDAVNEYIDIEESKKAKDHPEKKDHLYYRKNFFPIDYRNPFFGILRMTPEELYQDFVKPADGSPVGTLDNTLLQNIALMHIFPVPVPTPFFYMIFQGYKKKNMLEQKEFEMSKLEDDLNIWNQLTEADLPKVNVTKQQLDEYIERTKQLIEKTNTEIKTLQQEKYKEELEEQKLTSFDIYANATDVLLIYSRVLRLLPFIMYDSDDEKERQSFSAEVARLTNDFDEKKTIAGNQFMDALSNSGDQKLEELIDRVRMRGQYKSSELPVLVPYSEDAESKALYKHIADIFVPLMYRYIHACIKLYELTFVKFFGLQSFVNKETLPLVLCPPDFPDTSLLHEDMAAAMHIELVRLCNEKNDEKKGGRFFEIVNYSFQTEKFSYWNCMSTFAIYQMVESLFLEGMGNPRHISYRHNLDKERAEELLGKAENIKMEGDDDEEERQSQTAEENDVEMG